MSVDDRTRPHQIAPLNADGATLADGVYVISVVGGVVDEFIASSVVLLLPAGSDSSDVPSGTPTGSIILVKA